MLKIKIVGNGGGLNAGLAHNAFSINNHILVEAPPDIMLSLNRLQIDIGPIDTVFISHLHGDHSFGLPFLIINKWKQEASPFTILGPQGIARYTKELTEYAFTREHPCYEWMLENITFSTITAQSKMNWDSFPVSCTGLQHLVETYGFQIAQQQNILFAYIADTAWCEAVEQVLARKPGTVLMDMNAVKGVHISLDEVLEKGLPITGGNTQYYGTHLAEEFESPHPAVVCAKPGLELVIATETETSNLHD